MSNLSDEKKIEYLTEHIPYRIEWLVTIVDRNEQLNNFQKTNPHQLRGIINCAMNISGLSVRLFMEFLGLRAPNGQLIEKINSSYDKETDFDVHAKKLYGRLSLKDHDMSIDEQKVLQEVYYAGNKSIAHLKYDERDMDWWTNLEISVPIIKRLLKECVYDHIKEFKPLFYDQLIEKMREEIDVNGVEMQRFDKFPDSKYLFE